MVFWGSRGAGLRVGFFGQGVVKSILGLMPRGWRAYMGLVCLVLNLPLFRSTSGVKSISAFQAAGSRFVRGGWSGAIWFNKNSLLLIEVCDFSSCALAGKSFGCDF